MVRLAPSAHVQSCTERLILYCIILYQKIKEFSGFVPSIKFLFVGRSANETAHLCAKDANSSRRRCLWINYKHIPKQVLMKDCNPAICSICSRKKKDSHRSARTRHAWLLWSFFFCEKTTDYIETKMLQKGSQQRSKIQTSPPANTKSSTTSRTCRRRAAAASSL
jgi:hypothetical protein